MVSFLDNEGLKYYDERLKVWVEAKVEESSSASDKKIEELDNKVKTEVAQDVKLDLTEDYVLTVKLYNEEGTLISNDSVDLPIESLVKNGYYDEDKKEIVLELQDGTKIEIPVGDLVENKLDKTTEKNKIYGTQENGYQYTYNLSQNADSRSIVQRTEMGRIKSAYPVEGDDVATQKSVADGLATKLNRVSDSKDYLSVYAVTDDGKDAFLAQRSDEAKPWSVPLRFRQGQILAARSDIETDPEKLKDSEGNPVDTDNFLVTQGQLKEVNTKVDNRVQKTNRAYILYGTTQKDGATVQSELPFRSTPDANSIAQRTGAGRLQAVAGADLNDVVVVSQLKDVEDDLDLLVTNINDTTNTYYPNKEDKESFNTSRNSISGSNSIVGSKGFKLTQDNFHNACLGLFVIKPAIQDTLSDISLVKTMICERYGSSQTLTVIDSNAYVDDTNEYVTFLTQEPPYLYSDDTYSFSQITFKNEAGDIIGVLQPPKDQAADLIQWYGCVYQEGQLNPSISLNTYVELQGNYYMPKADNIGAFYYVDIPTNVITQNLVNEPTCIKIDANFDSGTRQSYKDWGDDGTLTTAIAEQCLKANYTVGNSYLTLFLKRNKREGQGLEQALVFGTSSCIRFTDHPEIGNTTVGLGFNNIFGDTDKGLFDFGFASGYGNTSIGRYSVTGGTRNSAVYAGVALGNHNIVLGQSGFAAGATNFISRSGSNGVALGSENILNGKNNIAGGRANNVSGLYGVAFGYGNKVRGNNGVALGYNNSQNNDLEFSVGLGNTLTGEGSITLGRANQAYGNYNVCIGYGNITNNAVYSTAIGHVNHGYANYTFLAGNDNYCYADASGTIGTTLKIYNSTDEGIYGNIGHFAVGSSNTVKGGRNVIIGGQSNEATLHDSIMVGNNLKENSKGFGKAIFGNFNDDTSYASIVLGAGSKNNQTGVITRRNVFEVFNDGRVLTPNAPAYLDSQTKRLTTKEYVDNKIVNSLSDIKAAYEEFYTIELIKNTNGYDTLSKYSDIKAAYEAGKVLRVHEIEDEDKAEMLPLMYASMEGNNASARFGYSYVAAGGESVVTVALDYTYDSNTEEESWHKETTNTPYFKLKETNGSLVAANDLDMGSCDIQNAGIIKAQDLRIMGGASIYIGATSISDDPNRPRLVGVANKAEAAFVKSFGQDDYIPLRVGTPTEAEHAVTKDYLEGIIGDFFTEDNNGSTSLNLVSNSAKNVKAYSLKLDCEGITCTNASTQEATVDFKWSGISPYTIEVTEHYNSSTGTSTYTSDITNFNEIEAAFNAKRPLQVLLNQENGSDISTTSLLPLMSADFTDDTAILVFGHTYVQHDGVATHTSAIELIHAGSNQMTWYDISSSSESLTKSAFNFDESTATLTVDLT